MYSNINPEAMTTDNSRYEEAAKEYAEPKACHSSIKAMLENSFLAGASFAEKDLKEEKAIQDNEDVRTLPENLEEIMTFLLYIEDRVGKEAFRHVYSCLEEAIQQAERKADYTTYKETHNNAIDAAIKRMLESIDEDTSIPPKELAEELEKLKL